MTKKTNYTDYIIGAGMTGLAAGCTSGFPIFEEADVPGGICSSYYILPKEKKRFTCLPKSEEAYRFDVGGGHWIFGGDPCVVRFIRKFVTLKKYFRNSSVFFREVDKYVPYPIQNHLRFLGAETAARCLTEIAQPAGKFCTMEEWMEENFGSSLSELFFFPFHELYTAGIYKKIAPQDAYKSPIEIASVIQGSLNEASKVGYNVTFVYPDEGLNSLSQRIADTCDIRYNMRVTKIDIKNKEVCFENGAIIPYNTLISTLPLNKMIDMADIKLNEKPDPYTSVLVLNIGAIRGDKCPDDHWLYIPKSNSDFHRVGFYSNVDRSFLPISSRDKGDKVSIYVEKAYLGGMKPSEDEISKYTQNVIKELQEMGFVNDVEVADPNWIDVAYTWSWPDSNWKQESIQKLEQRDIYQAGRYGRWTFQGIADSIRDGLIVGAALK